MRYGVEVSAFTGRYCLRQTWPTYMDAYRRVLLAVSRMPADHRARVVPIARVVSVAGSAEKER